MTYKDWINLAAILFSPIIAVAVTLWYQDRKDKRQVKKDIFFALMRNRNSIFIPKEYVDALNSIDYIFQDDEKVKDFWAQLYNNYNSKNPDLQQRIHLQIELLSEIAKHLGYSKLTQMQIDKYYTPQLHGDEADRNKQVSDELLRVLKASENFGISIGKNNMEKP